MTVGYTEPTPIKGGRLWRVTETWRKLDGAGTTNHDFASLTEARRWLDRRATQPEEAQP